MANSMILQNAYKSNTKQTLEEHTFITGRRIDDVCNKKEIRMKNETQKVEELKQENI
jgi:hypothetical protein